MSAVGTRVLCLCCGSYYSLEGECPGLIQKPHSLELALEVSRALLEQGIEHPDRHDVQETLHELGYR